MIRIGVIGQYGHADPTQRIVDTQSPRVGVAGPGSAALIDVVGMNVDRGRARPEDLLAPDGEDPEQIGRLEAVPGSSV